MKISRRSFLSRILAGLGVLGAAKIGVATPFCADKVAKVMDRQVSMVASEPHRITFNILEPITPEASFEEDFRLRFRRVEIPADPDQWTVEERALWEESSLNPLRFDAIMRRKSR